MCYSGISHKGLHRKSNEDAFFASGEPFYGLPNLYIVADGMGGHNAGDVASRLAIGFFKQHIAQNNGAGVSDENLLDILVEAFQFSNRNVFQESQQKEELQGMGTTLTAVSIWEDRMFCAHVGDSRIYGAKLGELSQLTNDHTFVMEMVRKGEITLEEAKQHPNRNILTRAVGTHEHVDVDTYIVPVGSFRSILLCTDGLPAMVEEDEILTELLRDVPVAAKAESLIELANRHGGLDNVSVVVIERRA